MSRFAKIIFLRVGSGGRTVPGYNLQVLDSEGQKLPPTHHGNLAIKLPLPPGCLLTLWNNEERYVTGYLDPFPGYFSTGDAGFIDEEGNVHILSRTDDIIKVAGHRLATGLLTAIFFFLKCDLTSRRFFFAKSSNPFICNPF